MILAQFSVILYFFIYITTVILIASKIAILCHWAILVSYFCKGNQFNPLSIAFSNKFATRKQFQRPFQLRSALH